MRKTYHDFFKRVLFTESEVISAIKVKGLKVAKVSISKIDTRNDYSYSSYGHPVIRYKVKSTNLNKEAMNSSVRNSICVDTMDEVINTIMKLPFDYFAMPSLFKIFCFMKKPTSDIFYCDNGIECYSFLAGIYKDPNKERFETIVGTKKKRRVSYSFKDAVTERISALKNDINPIFRQLKDFHNFVFEFMNILDREKEAIINCPRANKTSLSSWFKLFIAERNEK
jgi:hypothetical protein